MLVKATRFFISSIYGNVEAGKILEMSDARGQQHIDSGLAVLHANPLEVNSPFSLPVGAKPFGSALPAAQVSPKKIVKGSEFGIEKKVTAKKKGK